MFIVASCKILEFFIHNCHIFDSSVAKTILKDFWYVPSPLLKVCPLVSYIDFKNQYVYQVYYLTETKKFVLLTNFRCFFSISFSIERRTVFDQTFHRSDYSSFKKIEIDIEIKSKSIRCSRTF